MSLTKYLILTLLPISSVSFALPDFEQLTEYTDEFSKEMEENEQSDEGKAYQQDYAKKIKQEETQNRNNRKKRVACVSCPNADTIKKFLLRILKDDFPHNDYVYISKNVVTFRFYNAVHFDNDESRGEAYLERKYGVNYKDNVETGYLSKGHRILFENHPVRSESIFDFYDQKKIFFYTSGRFYLIIKVNPATLYRPHEISLYENEYYTPLSELQIKDPEFEMATNFSYKSSSQFFDGKLNVDAEMYVDTDLYKGTIFYNWDDKHFGNILYEGDNESRYSSYGANFGTEDNFSLGFKAVFVNNNKLTDADGSSDFYIEEDTYYFEANYKF